MRRLLLGSIGVAFLIAILAVGYQLRKETMPTPDLLPLPEGLPEGPYYSAQRFLELAYCLDEVHESEIKPFAQALAAEDQTNSNKENHND